MLLELKIRLAYYILIKIFVISNHIQKYMIEVFTLGFPCLKNILLVPLKINAVIISTVYYLLILQYEISEQDSNINVFFSFIF